MEFISARAVAQVILMSRELTRAEGELRAFVDRMSEDQQAELVALLWVGRGTYEPEDFAEAFDTALRESSTPTADYLIGTPHLSDHLEAGLELMGYSATDEEDDLM